MISFNELRFSEDLLSLEIDCELENTGSGEENEGYYIAAAYLEYYKNRNATGAPSSKSLIVFNNTEDDETVKSFSRTGDNAVNKSELSIRDNGVSKFSGELFYLIVSCKKTVDDSAEDDAYRYEIVNEIAAVLDWQKVYEIGMRYVASITNKKLDNCNIPDNLEQFVIVWHALELVLESKDIDMLDRLWSRFVSFSGGAVAGSPCNCG